MRDQRLNKDVSFDLGTSFDSHGAFDGYNKVYTVPMDGRYIVVKNGARMEHDYRHGDVIIAPESVIRENDPGE